MKSICLQKNRKIKMVYHQKDSLSQNFIKHRSLVDELVAESGLSSSDLVVEIGPGKGIITVELAKTAREVIAIEKDPALAMWLTKKFENFSNLKIVEGDFLNYELPTEPYKIVSNIPFSITSEILNKILLSERMPDEMYLILQLEAFLLGTHPQDINLWPDLEDQI